MFGQDVTIDQLESLLAVVDQGSFTGAARALRRTQGGVSYHVARLEEQLELTLFDRSSRRPVLTEAGQIVAREARNLVGDLRRLREVARGLRDGLEPRVTLAVDVLFPPARLAALIHRFHAAMPTVDLSVETGLTSEPISRLRSGAAQVAIAYQAVCAEMVSRPCLEVSILLVVAPEHPLARLERPIEPDDLRRYPNLVLPTDPRDEQAVQPAESSLRRWRVADAHVRHELVRAGVGWARLPRHQVEQDIAAGRLVVPDVSRLARPVLGIALRVATHPDRPPGPAGQWWVDQLGAAGEPA